LNLILIAKLHFIKRKNVITRIFSFDKMLLPATFTVSEIAYGWALPRSIISLMRF